MVSNKKQSKYDQEMSQSYTTDLKVTTDTNNHNSCIT